MANYIVYVEETWPIQAALAEENILSIMHAAGINVFRTNGYHVVVGKENDYYEVIIDCSEESLTCLLLQNSDVSMTIGESIVFIEV